MFNPDVDSVNLLVDILKPAPYTRNRRPAGATRNGGTAMIMMIGNVKVEIKRVRKGTDRVEQEYAVHKALAEAEMQRDKAIADFAMRGVIL
jgi:hypothetical protein